MITVYGAPPTRALAGAHVSFQSPAATIKNPTIRPTSAFHPRITKPSSPRSTKTRVLDGWRLFRFGVTGCDSPPDPTAFG